MSPPELKTVLYAGQSKVAESDDPAIWLQTMSAITGVATPTKVLDPSGPVNPSGGGTASGASDGSALGKFAAELEVSSAELDGACSPANEPPYIRLDHKHWEALKQNTPQRGVGAVPGVVLTATLLLLWARHLGNMKITAAMARDVLVGFGVQEKNQARSLKRCDWIQPREDSIRLNPANVPQAIKLARAYVAKTAP